MLKYRFFCPVCNKEVKRKEVYPVVEVFENTPKGSPRRVINRAFHFPNCKGNGDLKITILEGKQIQKKLGYTFDQKASGIDKDSLTKLEEKQDGNTTNDGIPPSPKGKGILPTII